MTHDVLILGVSTRAAAMSAIRCGLRPLCGDFFADRDLAAICPVTRIDPDDAARQFVALAESVSPTPWFYTGGFENHPDWVERISRKHRLWGIDAATLRAIRNPIAVADALGQAGLPVPEVRSQPVGLARDGSWLMKPVRSGGGRGIVPLTADIPGDTTDHYFQQKIEGTSFSALFVGAKREAALIGITRQWLGIEGSPFAYRGSLGPWPSDVEIRSRLRSLGNRLVEAFGLVGWFGVDFILKDGVPWPIEINPRYTASLEIHELATRSSLMIAHRDACEGRSNPDLGSLETPASCSRIVAKRILYAPRPMIAPEILVADDEVPGPFVLPSIADIPWPEVRFERGEPVMTILAEAFDVAECESRINEFERAWWQRLGVDVDRQSADSI